MLRSSHLLRCRPAVWFLLLVGPVLNINAQSWNWVERIGGSADENFEGLVEGAAGRLFFAGAYEAPFSMSGEVMPVWGGTDVLLAAANERGVIQWTAAAGSRFDDAVAGLVVDAAGAVLCTGTFWEEATFGAERIRTTANLKGIFLAKYEPSGSLRWVRVIEGTRLKEVTDMTTDEEGNIYLTGFFEDQLLVDTAVLQASGRSDLFLLKFDESGELIWATRDGLTGDTRSTRMALIGKEVVLAGFFNDTTLLAGQRLTANTFDRDVFVVRYDAFGQAKWARKAGGVHDEEVAGLAIAGNGDIFVAGALVGRMVLDEGLQIESKTGQSDFYLIRYSPEGIPLMGRAMGGDRLQQASDLIAFDEGVVVSGLYQGEMSIDGQSISAGSGFGSFVAHFDVMGNLNWIKNLPTDDGAFITHLSPSTDGGIVAGGTFRGAVSFDQFSFSTEGQFDLFLGKLMIQATSLDFPEMKHNLRIFPNPANQEIQLEGTGREFTVDLFDSRGRRVLYVQNNGTVSVGGLPPGVYTLIYKDKDESLAVKLVIQR